MISLLKCDFYKMKKEKAHLILLITMAGFMVFLFLIMLMVKNIFINTDLGGYLGEFPIAAEDAIDSAEIGYGVAAATFMSCITAGTLGIFVVLSVSMFIGNDFKNRTVNLKILCGHSRTKIYFGTLLVALITFMIFFLLCIAFSLALGYLMFAGFGGYLKDILIRAAFMLPPYLAVLSIAVLISICLKSTLGVVINVVVILLADIILTMLQMIMIDNAIFNFLLSVIPYTSIGSLASSTGSLTIDAPFVLKNILGSLMFAAGALTGGFFIFRKKELV